MTPVLRQELYDHARRLGGELPGDWPERIAQYVDLLRVWNERFHLTGDRDERRLALHHVADCVAVAPHVPPNGSFVDIGSGAGLPGLVVALSRPDARGTLIESRRRPATFLREACRTLGLERIHVAESRAEAFAAEPPTGWTPADTAMSRAVKAEVFLRLAEPLLRPGGLAVLMRGTALPDPPVPPAYALVRAVDYTLPDDTPRRLLLLRRVC